MKIYEALYCHNIHESSDCTISIHKTKEGAEKVIQECKTKTKEHHDRMYKNHTGSKLKFEWDSYKSWGINETELLD